MELHNKYGKPKNYACEITTDSGNYDYKCSFPKFKKAINPETQKEELLVVYPKKRHILLTGTPNSGKSLSS